ncbi:MAG: TRAP transporter large permease subunit [bacterium]|jgi:TRAP-type C4-dicarboxylate transport system permease large subunit
MLGVVIPVLALFAIILLPLPRIGGDVRIALLASAVLALLLGGVGPVDAVIAAVDGINRIAWVIGLSIFGSIYAQSQIALGTMDTVLDTFRSLFGRSPKGLVAAVVLSLVLAGSLIGDAIASATVIGVLVIMALAELKLTPEQIGVTILTGAVLGSIMPPITQAIFLASSLMGISSDPVMNIGYFTVGAGVIIALINNFRFVKIKELPAELIPSQSAGEILRTQWYNLVPLSILAAIVILRSGFQIEVLASLDFFWNIFKGVPILQGFTNRILQAIIIATLASTVYPRVSKRAAEIVTKGLSSVSKTVQIQLCAGVMIGSFMASGMIEKVVIYTEGLAPAAMKLGGGFAMMLIGMLTGSQTTAQTTLAPFLGPILTDTLGIEPTSAALGISHLAMAGQSMPPVCLTTFVVVGIVGGIIGKKVDPVRVMFLAFPVTIYFALAGFAAFWGLI